MTTTRESSAVVYVLQHSYEVGDDSSETKLLGVYRTEEAAAAAIASLQLKPGFCDHPDDFSIDRYELNQTHWVEGFVTVT